MADNRITRIPLNIVATASGQVTEGVLVGVLADELLALEGLVRFLVKEADMKRDTEGQWWSDDWEHEVTIDPYRLAVINKLIPAGRTF